MRSVERDGTGSLTSDEARIVSLLKDLLHEAEPDANPREPMSARLLTVWGDLFDGVNVWGSIFPFYFPNFSYSEFGKDIQGRR